MTPYYAHTSSSTGNWGRRGTAVCIPPEEICFTVVGWHRSSLKRTNRGVPICVRGGGGGGGSEGYCLAAASVTLGCSTCGGQAPGGRGGGGRGGLLLSAPASAILGCSNQHTRWSGPLVEVMLPLMCSMPTHPEEHGRGSTGPDRTLPGHKVNVCHIAVSV